MLTIENQCHQTQYIYDVTVVIDNILINFLFNYIYNKKCNFYAYR